MSIGTGIAVAGMWVTAGWLIAQGSLMGEIFGGVLFGLALWEVVHY